jgi:hypothetical protein
MPVWLWGPPDARKEEYDEMLSVKRWPLALFLALSTLSIPRVQAQQPAIPQPSPLPPNQPVTYRYSDNDGFGTITLTDIGVDPGTGGHLLQVRIVQNGTTFDGSGLTYPLPTEPRPLNNLITFTVQAQGGVPFFFQGKMGLGVEFQGSGTFHPVSDPTQSQPWGLLFVPGNPNPGPTVTLSIDQGCGSTYVRGQPIVIQFGSSVNDTLTLISQRSDGSQSVVFANFAVQAGQTYSVSSFVGNVVGQRTLTLTGTSGGQATCTFTGQ